MTLTLTKLYEILSSKIGREEAESLTSYIEEKISTELEEKKSSIVNEVAGLRVEIEKVRVEIEKVRGDNERALRQQLWAIFALFIPLYITIAFALFRK